MSRRRNQISEFFDGFNQGYQTVGKVLKDREIREISDAKPETSHGFTADQGAELQRAADSGQYDIGYDEAAKAYTVTPKSDPTQTGTIAQQGVTDFMGRRTAGEMTDGQANSARMSAMAGVYKKHGDVAEGMRLEQQATSAQREDERWGRQKKQWDREDQTQAKEDEYKAGRESLFANTRFGKNQATYAQQMKEYQDKAADYEANKAAGKNEGPAPAAPQRPEYSIGDSLADRAALIDHDAKHGKLDSRTFGEFTDILNKTQSEGYEKALRLAQSGAPVAEVVKQFNSSGKTQIDPASVISDKLVKGKDGLETRVIEYKDANGNTRTVNTLAELDSLGKANEVFSRHYQAKGDQRSDEQLKLSKNADGRAAAAAAMTQAEHKMARDEKQAKADAAVALYKERTPNATDAELSAVRAGVLQAVTTADKNAPAEVKLAQAYKSAGLAKTDAEALQMATRAKGHSPDQVKADIYGKALTANMGNADAAQKATEQAMGYLYPPEAQKPAQAAKPLQNVTPADISATAKKYNITEDEVRRRLGIK